MNEKRLTTRLLQHWETIRAHSAIPRFEEFDAEDIKDVWPQCMIVRIEGQNHRFVCERMGEKVISVCGRDLTSQPLDPRAEKFPDVILLGNLEEVYNAMGPIEGTGQFVGIKGGLVKWRACFMPFGEGKRLTHILVGFSFKEM